MTLPAAVPVLSASRLTLSLSLGVTRVKVVEDITFSIATGEFYAIVGESGSGKTVLARAVMRLFAPGILHMEGSLRLQGVDIAAASGPVMRRLRGSVVSMVFQEPMSALNPLLTVAAQVSEALAAHRPGQAAARRKRILELLDDVGFDAPD